MGRRLYTHKGFRCEGEKVAGAADRLYGCGRVRDGKAYGVGFFYYKPRASASEAGASAEL